MIPEREKDLEWKTGERNNSGARNRSHCCNSTKSEAPESGPGTESCLKQNGGPPSSAAAPTTCLLSVSLVSLVQQVCILLVSDESAPPRGAAVAFASRARTLAARQVA